MNHSSTAMIQKQRHSHPNGSCLVLHTQKRCGKVAARSRPYQLCFLIGKVSLMSMPLQAKQLMSTSLMFFISWEMQYDKNGLSYGQLVIGSFIATTHLLLHHVSCRVFWQNITSPRWLSPATAQIWCPATSGFSQNWNHLWKGRDFRQLMRFRKIWWSSWWQFQQRIL